MMKKGTIVLITLVIGMVCITGCTSDTGGITPTLTPVPGETAVATTQQAPDLRPQPTDAIPTTKAVSFGTSKDPITGDITVTFGGGKGQGALTSIEVVVISGTGKTTTKDMKLKTGGENAAVFTVENGEATKGEDRVMVTVSFTDGTSYKVYDDIVKMR